MRFLKTRLTRFALAVVLSASALAMTAPAANALPRPSDPLPGSTSTSSTACLDPVGTPGYIPALQFRERNWPLTGGLHMDTSGSVNRNTGLVTAQVHLYNSYWGMGYTGGTLMVLYDKCGGTIGVTKPAQWGVDAKLWAWSMNERKALYSADVPVWIANRVASVRVINTRVTGDAMINLYREIRGIACGVLVKVPFMGGHCPLPEFR